jgi:Kef-type K+ transport system membrane component KefB
MLDPQIVRILVSVAVLVTAARVLGAFSTYVRQPRFVGEILAGVVVGPFVLGRFLPDAARALLGQTAYPTDATRVFLEFASWLGLMLLMFVSGSQVRRLLAPEQRRPTAWILGLGTAAPFALAFGVGALLPLDRLHGPRGTDVAFLVVLAAAASVTSIPVISRIFHDLGILHSRFASLVLGTAMLEDIGLFAALAVATALAGVHSGSLAGGLAIHMAITSAYLVLGLSLAPHMLGRIHDARWNVLARHSPLSYAVVLMFGYAGVAALLDVNPVFGAFLAGFGLVGGVGGGAPTRFTYPLETIGRVAFAVFVPLYFVVVGARLDLGAGFSFAVLLVFAAGTSALRMGFVTAAARLSGFAPRDAADVGVAMNARGGPGIVLASVALEAGIIAPTLFTALVLTAIATSIAAGWWLARTLRRRGELLGERIEARGVQSVHAGSNLMPSSDVSPPSSSKSSARSSGLAANTG